MAKSMISPMVALAMAAFMVLFVAPPMAYAYDDCDPVEGCDEKENPEEEKGGD